MTVAVVGGVRRQQHEMDLEGLGQERVVARAYALPGPGLGRIARVRHLAVVDYHGVGANPRGVELPAPEFLEPVGLRGHAAKEDPARLGHVRSSIPGEFGLTFIPIWPRTCHGVRWRAPGRRRAPPGITPPQGVPRSWERGSAAGTGVR